MLQLRRNGSLLEQQTTGDDGLYRFPNLTPGSYTLSEQPPPGYEPASPTDNVVIAALAGQQTEYNFAHRPLPTATPTATLTPSPTSHAHCHPYASSLPAVSAPSHTQLAVETFIMNLVAWYENYWQSKSDNVDHRRLDLMLPYIRPGQSVFQLDGGPGMLAERIQKERGAHVIMTDLTEEAVARARAKGIVASQLYIAEQDIPYPDAAFDVVVSDSAIEHHFDPARSFDELARVLKPGGVFILCLPNIAHWRCRLWLLRGRFPYAAATPTDFTHLRFFTLNEIRSWLQARRIEITAVDGSASLWVRGGFYPGWLRYRPLARLYTRLARRWPTLFARDLIIIGQKRLAA